MSIASRSLSVARCTRRARLAVAPALLLAALAGLTPAQAERGDRDKPFIVEADQSGAVDLQRQVLVYTGNVVIAQGSMVLRAERVELRELPDGHRVASAIGTPARQASWRQKRDGVDETVEGSADRIEFDGRADTLRFTGQSVVRRLRGATVADEITGGTIVWDNVAEVFSVVGGARTVSNPSGRVRAVLSPRTGGTGGASVTGSTPPPASVSPAVSPAASAPSALRPSRGLGER